MAKRILIDTNSFVQIATAYAYDLEIIVTRDSSGFQDSNIPVFSPAEMLAKISSNGETE